MKPISIYLDGTDGTGKTTLIEGLVQSLNWESDPSLFQFPSRMPEAHEKETDLCRAMFHLQDFHEVMREHRARGDARIFDRSFLSTLAYQGFSEGLKLHPRFDAVFSLGAETLLAGEPRTQVFFHLTADPKVAAERVSGRATDRVYDIEEEEDALRLTERLQELRTRLEWSYMHCKTHLRHLHRQHDYHFLELDTSQVSPSEVLGRARDLLQIVTG